jgi:hypothetical protein
MSKFSIYLIGYLIFVAGVGVAMMLLNVPSKWIVVGMLVMVGLGIVAGTTATKRDDPPSV